jgi:hypothetical protein
MIRGTFSSKSVLLPLLILLITIGTSGCGAPVTSHAKPQEDLKEKFVGDWERINATIEELSYPEASLLFAPRERPSMTEQMAQERHNIRFNRSNKHSAIYKTSDPLEKVIKFYSNRHLRPEPVVRDNQRVFICCEPEVRVTLTKFEDGTSITIEVPSGTQPKMQLANSPTSPDEN